MGIYSGPPPTLPVLAVVTAYSCLLGSQWRAHSGRGIVAPRPTLPSTLPVRCTPCLIECGFE